MRTTDGYGSAARSGRPDPTPRPSNCRPAPQFASWRSTAPPPWSGKSHDPHIGGHWMNAALIAILIVAVVFLIVLLRSVRIVPQARAAVVERLGRYVRTQGPGVAVLVPFVDRMRPLIDMREQVVSFPPQPVITSDNLTVAIDSVIYFQVTDPRAASYEIQNYIQAVEQLTITTLRNVVGALNLEQALTSRDSINTQLRGVLDEATGPWGIRVARVEIKAIDPPPSIQDAMEAQMRADRNKRAVILAAEGQRESAIKTAEGQKASQILSAEGQKQSAILAAEAERQSRILRAEGERAARYLAAQGQAKANEMWIVPTEFGKALEGLSRLGGEGEQPSWLDATSAVPGSESTIDTSDWFDSNLPPAREQPEAVNLRASDEDPDSLAARTGMPPQPPLPP